MKLIAAGAATLLLALLAGCGPKAAPPADVQPAQVDVPPEVYRGSGLARQVCSQCHDISAGSPPVQDVGAPTFDSVANRDGMTAEHLRTWMASSHPSMPTYMFDAASVDDVSAYIMSLRRNR